MALLLRGRWLFTQRSVGWWLNVKRQLTVSASVCGTVEELEKAKQAVLTLTQDPGNDVKLQLYGLYKQVGLRLDYY